MSNLNTLLDGNTPTLPIDMNGQSATSFAEWEYARQLLHNEFNELSRGQKRAVDVLLGKYVEDLEKLSWPKPAVPAGLIRYAQALAIVKGPSDKVREMIESETELAGNLLVIAPLADGWQRNIARRVYKEEIEHGYKKAVAYLREQFNEEEVESLLNDKEQLLTFYSQFANRIAKAGNDVVELALSDLADQLIAVVGEGNYVFNLTGDIPDPYELDDDTFYWYLHDELEILPVYQL
jgi:hypothetical protein